MITLAQKNLTKASVYLAFDTQIEAEVIVFAQWMPLLRGDRDEFGRPLEPDLDGFWEIIDIYVPELKENVELDYLADLSDLTPGQLYGIFEEALDYFDGDYELPF